MIYRGTVRDGVVVLPPHVHLPDGMDVAVQPIETQTDENRLAPQATMRNGVPVFPPLQDTPAPGLSSVRQLRDETPNNEPRRDWLLEMADVEGTVRSTSVGGMAADLGLLPLIPADSKRVFGRLLEFARRARGLSVEQLAEQANVDFAEVVEIEQHDDAIPQPRTVYQLAQALELPADKLIEVAGLAKARREIRDAALRFAARSEPTTQLTPVEREAFEEFVKVLVENSDGG
jgi:transcriptional regulator with XRE-family HTH domain